jgi:hypothetical protein
VLAANVRPPEGAGDVVLITDPATARCADLFNVAYEVLLQVLHRYFAHTEESDAQLSTLANVGVDLMFKVIEPLGIAITTLPVGADHPGMTAGPSFELFYESDYLLPHREATWLLLEERLREAADFADRTRAETAGSAGATLESCAAALRELADTLAAG